MVTEKASVQKASFIGTKSHKHRYKKPVSSVQKASLVVYSDKVGIAIYSDIGCG